MLVSARGFEPPRPFGHQLLRLARLPFRHADYRAKTIGPGLLEVLDLDRFDLVSDLEPKDPRQEVHLPLDRAPDVLLLPESVLLALEWDVRIRQHLLPADGNEFLGLTRRHDLILEALEEDHRNLEVVREVDCGAIPVHVRSLRIRTDERVDIARLELVSVFNERLEVADPEMARAGVVEITLGQRKQRGESAGGSTCDRYALLIDEPLLDEIPRRVDAVVDIDLAPISVQSPPVCAAVAV